MGNIIFVGGTATAGNSNFDYTIPANKRYQLLYGHVVMTTDATVANRYLEVSALDGATAVTDIHSGAAQTASLTSQHYELMQGVYRETSFINGKLQFPIPDDFKLQGGWTLRVNVTNGVAGDSFTPNLVFEDVT